MNDEARRAEVADLLRKCTDKKLLRGGTWSATEDAERAHELATAEPELPTPWPQLAAYRLAHLILRGAPTGDELMRADELLARASGDGKSGVGNPLGPLPLLYRLAVLHRLASEAPRPESQRARAELPKALDQARDAVLRRLAVDESQSGRRSAGYQRPQVQHGLFNMLELSTYFMGSTTQNLEGIGSVYEDLMLDSEQWRMVGTVPGIADIRMPRQLALVELDERGSAHPDAVLFRLGLAGAQWRVASKSEWRVMNADHARLLGCLLGTSGEWSTERLRAQVVGTDGEDPDARFRQVMARLKSAFRELTGRPDVELFVREPGHRIPRVSANLTIFGAVDRRTRLYGR